MLSYCTKQTGRQKRPQRNKYLHLGSGCLAMHLLCLCRYSRLIRRSLRHSFQRHLVSSCRHSHCTCEPHRLWSSLAKATDMATNATTCLALTGINDPIWRAHVVDVRSATASIAYEHLKALECSTLRNTHTTTRPQSRPLHATSARTRDLAGEASPNRCREPDNRPQSRRRYAYCPRGSCYPRLKSAQSHR